jgi:hypothetical protein
MEIRGDGLEDLPIYIPGGGHEWVEIPTGDSKGRGTIIFNCANCDSVLCLSFFPGKKAIFGKQKPGSWMCSVQRSEDCCTEPA